MNKTRLEAFSDGVIAIIITIMVLELRVPHATGLAALVDLWPVFSSYVLSFVYVGIYWNNHHHLLHAARHIDGWVLWANLHLLFWLSLIPFASGWMGENHFATTPVLLYGVVLFMTALAYYVLVRGLTRAAGPDSELRRAVGGKRKELLSLVAYGVALAVAWTLPLLSLLLYVAVAVAWFVPDRRIERRLPHPAP